MSRWNAALLGELRPDSLPCQCRTPSRQHRIASAGNHKPSELSLLSDGLAGPELCQPPPSALKTAIWSCIRTESDAATAASAATSACSAVRRSRLLSEPATN